MARYSIDLTVVAILSFYSQVIYSIYSLRSNTIGIATAMLKLEVMKIKKMMIL